MLMGKVAKQFAENSVVSVCTFGSPPPGDLRVANNIFAEDIARWQNIHDYVTAMPFFPENAPTAWRLANAAMRVNWANQIQAGEGRALFPDGSIGRQNLILVEGMIAEASMLNFMVNNDALVAQEHAIATYHDRLRLAINTPVAPADQVNAVNNAMRQIPVVGHGVPFDALQAIQAQPLPEVPVRAPQSFGQNPLPFQSGLENGAPVVRYYDTIIAIGKTRKQARDLARALNSSFKRWNRTRVGNADNLLYAVENVFLEE